MQIVLTAAATLIGGMVLYLLSEMIKVSIILPAQRTREAAQVAIERVDFYSNRLTNYFPKDPSGEELELIKTIKKELRRSATELKSNYSMLALANYCWKLKLVPSKDEISVAYQGLIYLHNSILYSEPEGFVVNRIEMNHTQILRVIAALTGKEIPPNISPKERNA